MECNVFEIYLFTVCLTRKKNSVLFNDKQNLNKCHAKSNFFYQYKISMFLFHKIVTKSNIIPRRFYFRFSRQSFFFIIDLLIVHLYAASAAQKKITILFFYMQK